MASPLAFGVISEVASSMPLHIFTLSSLHHPSLSFAIIHPDYCDLALPKEKQKFKNRCLEMQGALFY